MKYLVKFFVVTFFLITSTNAFAEQKIVVLDMKYVLNNSKAGKGAQEFLKKKFNDNEKKFSDLENSLKKEEIDLLKNYPKPNRDVKSRASSKSEKDRSLAREFGEAFFDGDRSHGYGGFNYNPRFWEPVIPTFIEHWNLKSGDSILDVGCAKGFMIFDFYRMIEGLKVNGFEHFST